MQNRWLIPLMVSLFAQQPLAVLAQTQDYDDVPIKTVVPLDSSPSRLYTVPTTPLSTNNSSSRSATTAPPSSFALRSAPSTGGTAFDAAPGNSSGSNSRLTASGDNLSTYSSNPISRPSSASNALSNYSGSTNPSSSSNSFSSSNSYSSSNSQRAIGTSNNSSESTRSSGEQNEQSNRSSLSYNPTESGSNLNSSSYGNSSSNQGNSASGNSTTSAATPSAGTGQSSGTTGSGITANDDNAPSAQEHARQLAQKTQELAQASGLSPRRNQLPGVVGTVQIRKGFKLFVTEQLIHNLSFRDTPVKEVIAEIARRGNLNILIDKSVTGKITGELRDVTLNEAMDSVLAAAGLQHRTLDNNTVIIASLQAMAQLGLNRSMARVFKLSYAHPYDVAMILHASVFNRGMLPDYTRTSQRESTSGSSSTFATSKRVQGGGAEPEGAAENKSDSSSEDGPNSDKDSTRDTQVTRPDLQRVVRGSSRTQTQEGVGFNNAATDPGSQQIRSFQEVNTDYIVEQNGGGAIVITGLEE